MNIIIIGPAHPLRGGIADTNESLCRALKRQGHQCKIVSFSLQYPSILFPGRTQFRRSTPPQEVDIISRINSINPFTWWTTARWINAQQPDLVMVRFWIPFLGLCLGSILRMLHDSVSIIAITDNIKPHEGRIGDRFLTKFFLKPCDAFITLSEAVLKELRTFTTKPSICFPHPINDHFGPILKQSIARSKLDLRADLPVVLFFGLVRKYKGLDLLIKAIANEQLRQLGALLIIAGEFYDDEKYYRNLISQLEVEGRVVVHNRFVPVDEIPVYFSAADIVAQTYRSASQSGITPIAYHFNRPVRVSNSGGVGEMVEPGKTGYIVELDAVKIAEALTDFFENRRFASFSQSVAKHKIKYSWDAFAGHVQQLYANLTSS